MSPDEEEQEEQFMDDENEEYLPENLDTDVCEDFSGRKQKRDIRQNFIPVIISNIFTRIISYFNASGSQLPEDFKHIIETVNIIKTNDGILNRLESNHQSFVQCDVQYILDNGIFSDFGNDMIGLLVQAHGVDKIEEKLARKNAPYKLGMLSVAPANMCGIMKRCTHGFDQNIPITITKRSDSSEDSIDCPINIPKNGADSIIKIPGNILTTIKIQERISLDLMITAAISQLSNFCLKYNSENSEYTITQESRLRALIYLQDEIYTRCNNVRSEFTDEIFNTPKNILQLIEPQNDKAYYYTENPGENEVNAGSYKGEYRQKTVPVYGLFVLYSGRMNRDSRYSLSNTMVYSDEGPKCILPGYDVIGTNQSSCNTIDTMTDNINAYNLLWNINKPGNTSLYWLQQIDDKLNYFIHHNIISELTRYNLILYWFTNMNIDSPENYLTEIILYFGIILGYCIEIIDPSCRMCALSASKYKNFKLAYQTKPRVSKNKRFSYILNTAITDTMGMERYEGCKDGWKDKNIFDSTNRIEKWLKILNHTEVDDMLNELRIDYTVGKDFASIVKLSKGIRSKSEGNVAKSSSNIHKLPVLNRRITHRNKKRGITVVRDGKSIRGGVKSMNRKKDKYKQSKKRYNKTKRNR